MDDWFHHWFDEDYAALYAHRDEAEAGLAVATALREAPELGQGPVMDLACGAGRHLLELRRTNPAAFGVDLSPALLRLAPEPLRPHLLQADMRRLPVKAASLSGIAMWFTPFGYFSDEANEALLHALEELLRPGGALLVDYLNAAQLRATLVPEDEIERAGIRVRSRRRLEGGRVIKEMELRRLDTGETRQALESVRVYEPGELTTLASRAGLRLRKALGDYDGGAFTADSPRWIGIFERI
ncbi:MAG TPA: class I SAM-dependent methyltransferase [Holophagaceae bacterium]|nr:class I SAM-dependent methyltransferase [Holophagaceae bacterium]